MNRLSIQQTRASLIEVDMVEVINDMRNDLLIKFGATVVGQLNHPAICGSEPFQLIARPDGFLYEGIAGYRVAQLRLNVGLRNKELVDALTPDKLAFFVPWELETPPVAYIDPTAMKYVTVEAAYPRQPHDLQKTRVSLYDGMQFPDHGEHFVTGKNMRGVAITIPYRFMIHVLGAGTTGSGKSTFLQSAVHQTAKGNKPGQPVKNIIVLATGKMSAAFAKINGVPGQQGPIACQEQDIINAFGWVVGVMNERYSILEKTGKLVDTPAIHVFFDEFQELTEDARQPTVTELHRQMVIKGRECGVHCWDTTHKPNLRMFGKAGNAVKGQFSTIIGLQMPDAVSSRVLRGDDTCTYLCGRGDARVLAEVDGAVTDARVQMAYVPDDKLAEQANHKPVFAEWPEFDLGALDRSLNRKGRPVDPYTDEQLACAIHVGRQDPKHYGRGALAKLLAREAQPIAGGEKVARLLKKGRTIAAYLDELDAVQLDEYTDEDTLPA